MSRKDIVGSWFPTGYHGNYLCKTRPDPCSEYRLLAKPTPPNRFMYRMTEKSVAHPFSKHDNKYMFPTDAMYLGKGVGRRKIGPKSTNENLLSWHSLQSRQAPPNISGYRQDFHSKAGDTYNQKLVRRPATSFDVGRPLTTTYRYAHGLTNPNRDLLVDIVQKGTKVREVHSAKDRTPLAPFSSARQPESVARCMTWCMEPCRSYAAPSSGLVSPPYERDDVRESPKSFPVVAAKETTLQESICAI